MDRLSSRFTALLLALEWIRDVQIETVVIQFNALFFGRADTKAVAQIPLSELV